MSGAQERRAAPAVEALARGVLAGQRRSLARAISLAESQRPGDAAKLLQLVAALNSAHRRSMRIGISGAPGVGKSSFIEKLGALLIGQGRRLAIIAVDPSSARSGGSILGDKTRMVELSASPHAFVRPFPSGPRGGGIAPATADALFLCECAGFDLSLVETVGVGQGETAVSEVVDVLLVLLEPGAGDELQGIKRGLLEWADLVVIHKADGAARPQAERSQAQYAGALQLLRATSGEAPPVLLASSLEKTGLSETWQAIEARFRAIERDGRLPERRARQLRSQLRRGLEAAVLGRLFGAGQAAEQLARVERRVEAGEIPVRQGIEELLAAAFAPPQPGEPAEA